MRGGRAAAAASMPGRLALRRSFCKTGRGGPLSVPSRPSVCLPLPLSYTRTSGGGRRTAPLRSTAISATSSVSGEKATGGSRPELRVACWEPRRHSGQRDPLRHRSRHRHRYRRRCRPDESLTAAFEAAPGERRKFLLQRRVRLAKGTARASWISGLGAPSRR